MKKLAYILMAAVLFASCSNNSDKTEPQTTDLTSQTATTEMEEEVKIINGMMSFGEEITPEGAVSYQEMLAQLANNDSVIVKMEATINECCKKKGCWMKLDMGDNEMMVRFKDYGFFVPKDADGKTAIVNGVVKKTVITVDELKHYAEDAGKTKEEIDAITEPKEEITFLADGVLIKG